MVFNFEKRLNALVRLNFGKFKFKKISTHKKKKILIRVFLWSKFFFGGEGAEGDF